MELAPRTGERNIPALVIAVAATLGLLLWMTNQDPVPHGPLIGAMIALVATIAWVITILPPTGGASIDWRETALAKQTGDCYSPLAGATAGLFVVAVIVWWSGAEALPIAICVGLLCLVQPALRRPGLLAALVVTALYLPMLGAFGLLSLIHI